MVPRTFLFIFYAGSRRLGSNNFRNSSYKEKTACFQTIFPFLMTMLQPALKTRISQPRLKSKTPFAVCLYVMIHK